MSRWTQMKGDQIRYNAEGGRSFRIAPRQPHSSEVVVNTRLGEAQFAAWIWRHRSLRFEPLHEPRYRCLTRRGSDGVSESLLRNGEPT